MVFPHFHLLNALACACWNSTFTYGYRLTCRLPHCLQHTQAVVTDQYIYIYMYMYIYGISTYAGIVHTYIMYHIQHTPAVVTDSPSYDISTYAGIVQVHLYVDKSIRADCHPASSIHKKLYWYCHPSLHYDCISIVLRLYITTLSYVTSSCTYVTSSSSLY